MNAGAALKPAWPLLTLILMSSAAFRAERSHLKDTELPFDFQLNGSTIPSGKYESMKE